MRNDFAVFILTHGRADNVITYNTLYKQGYTGKVYIVIDNEDEAAADYKNRFGDKVVVFDKEAISKTFDTGDNLSDRRTVVFARNACFDLARQLNVKYFMQLDDDYVAFEYKFDKNFNYWQTGKKIKSLDKVLEAVLDFYIESNALTVAFAQNGDFMGGRYGGWAKSGIKLYRKAMNTFMCSVDRPFQFVGRVNEDVNTYTTLGNRGMLLLTVPNVSIIPKSTQQGTGGMTDLYLDYGTYMKSVYTVMYSPSNVSIRSFGNNHKRLHHNVAWKNASPLVIANTSIKPTGSA